MDTILIQRVSVERLLDLRHRVLRAGLPPDTARFDGDLELTTVHLGAIDRTSGDLLGCCTLVRRAWADTDEPAWQLRGMAIEPPVQRTGVGSRLLEVADDVARWSTHAPLLWCNAREPAVPFYERHGWTRVGTRFDIPTAGPHFRMTKRA
jgi:GNAT superfamily N-acetyltransferase